MSNTTIVSNKAHVARESWTASLNNLYKEFAEIYGHSNHDLHLAHDEEEFRSQFANLDPERHGEPQAVNYGVFTRYHDPIHRFSKAIDQTIGFRGWPNVQSIFWTFALAYVELAFARGWDFDRVSDVYEDLTRDFPQLPQADLCKHPRDEKIQACLSAIFEAYAKCYLELIAQIDSHSHEIDMTAVDKEIAIATTTYKQQELDWKIAVEDAASRPSTAGMATPVPGQQAPTVTFEYVSHLGRGSYGSVDVVKEITTGTVYARKQIAFNAGGTDPEIIADRVKNEADVMTKLKHNHIASVQIWYKTTVNWTIIMMPVAECDLRTFLQEKCIDAGYPLIQTRLLDTWFGCLSSALNFAHEEKIKHEDIKPSNILILKKKVFLTDFGTAKDFSELEASTATDYLEQGTPIYWPPEERPWGRAADVFALGCVFSEMLTVRQKRDLKEYRKYRAARSHAFQFAYRTCLEKSNSWLTSELGITEADPVGQTILEQTCNMLIEEPGERPSAERVKNQLRAQSWNLFCNTCR